MSQMHSDKILASVNDSTKLNNSSPYQIPLTDSIINYGKIFLNTRYHRGSCGSTAFDCSGFTSFVYHNFGYELKRSSADQAKQVDSVDPCNLKTGDLVFFSGRHRSNRVGHVGIVVSADQDGKFNFIHASVQNGVIISNSDEPYYLKRYIKAGRVIADSQTQLTVQPNTVFQNENTKSVSVQQHPVIESKKIIHAEYYRVKKGETLSSIAHKCGISLAELKRMNKIKGNKINPKQRIKIKDAETVLLAQTIQPQITGKQPTEIAEIQPEKDFKTIESDLTTNQNESSHVVKKGETLFSISKLYNISVPELKKINNLSNSKIKFGQEIKLSKSDRKKENTSKNSKSISKIIHHKVQSGETYYSIAKLYGCSVSELKNWNNKSGNKIKVGEKVIIHPKID
jgi:LysM repeat protein